MGCVPKRNNFQKNIFRAQGANSDLEFNCGGFQFLEGKYLLSDFEIFRQITFDGQKHFTDTAIEHLMEYKVGAGNFKLRRKFLDLEYLNQYPIQLSHYNLQQKKSESDQIGQIFIEILDKSDSNPIHFALCGLKDKTGKLVANLFTDTVGKVGFSIYSPELFESLLITNLGYEKVEIPISEFIGNNNFLKVYLSRRSTYYINPGKYKYRIGKLSNKELILLDSNHKKLFFRKTE